MKSVLCLSRRKLLTGPGEVDEQQKLARHTSEHEIRQEIVAKAKAVSRENCRHRLESDYLSVDKVLRKIMRRLRRGTCPIICSINNASGELLSCDKNILNQWKEYFVQVYNSISERRGAPSEPERDETSDISTDELQAAIRAFKPGEDAPIDKIPLQIVKSLSCFKYCLAQ